MTSAYIFDTSRVYVYDGSAYYLKMGRFIDDGIAHELTHYVQFQYKGWTRDMFRNEYAVVDFEGTAQAVQTWFRESYMKGDPPPGAPVP